MKKMKFITTIFCLLPLLSSVILEISGVPKKKNCTNRYISEKELVTKYLQPDDVGRNRKYDNLNHKNLTLCTRNCTKYPKPRICYYIFNVETYSAMGAACRNCSTGNMTDCNRRQCIQADGIERMVVSINRMIPGPSIDVCYGDRIVVDVNNRMPTSALSIHWHGVLQKDTPWMDGVPFVTQCPINPNSKFRYNFPAHTNGTLLYHAHIAFLQPNGVYGTLTIRTPKGFDPNEQYHDQDLPSHTIHVADWTHFPIETFYPGYYRNASHYPTKPDGYLINGRGSYRDSVTVTDVPHSEFHVQCGQRYRFRIIASATSTCSFKFGIEDHTLLVVALDGYPCAPFNVSTLIMSSGQRTDVVILPKQDCSKTTYWIVVKGIDECENTTNAQTANLVYDNAPPRLPTTEDLSYIYDAKPYMNHHGVSCNDNDNICADTLPPAPGFKGPVLSASRVADYQFTIKAGFHRYTADQLFETNSFQHFYEPFGPGGLFVAGLNNVSGIFPPVPLLTQEKELPKDLRICHGNCTAGEAFCRCVNILEVKLNSLVEIQFEEGIIHPIHIHGHHFTVVHTVKPTPAIQRNGVVFSYAPGTIQRDVVHVPLGGLARVKFVADNPGYWIMHCHFNAHFEGGMFLIFKVGNSSQFKRPPKCFPRCGDFSTPVEAL